MATSNCLDTVLQTLHLLKSMLRIFTENLKNLHCYEVVDQSWMTCDTNLCKPPNIWHYLVPKVSCNDTKYSTYSKVIKML